MATDVAAPFPAVELRPGSVITVTLDDPAAIVSTLAVHGFQDVATVEDQIAPPSPVSGAYTMV